MADWSALQEWSRAVARLEVSGRQLERLRRYVDLLLVWNRKVALVSQRDANAILAKHVADSLFVAANCPPARSIADLGSGAGFPGIPIAIANPSARVCLIESRGKKVSFLEEVRRRIHLENCEIFHGRIETAAAARGQTHDLVVSRALATPNRLIPLGRSLLAPGGRLVIMLASSATTGSPRISYQLPDGTPRELHIIQFDHDGIA